VQIIFSQVKFVLLVQLHEGGLEFDERQDERRDNDGCQRNRVGLDLLVEFGVQPNDVGRVIQVVGEFSFVRKCNGVVLQRMLSKLVF